MTRFLVALALAGVVGLPLQAAQHVAPAGHDAMQSARHGQMAGMHDRHQKEMKRLKERGVRTRIPLYKPSRSLKVLTPEVSRSLRILPIPTDEPIPLIIGHTWRCFPAPEGFEDCEPVLVVCNNEQTICTEH